MFKVLLIFLLFISFTLPAQDIQPKGGFLSDTVKVGEPVEFTLAVKYPREADLVFPDSTYNFAPFEFERKKYFPTRTDSLYSYDSVIYTLATFEIDTIQYLRLPVYNITQRDSTAFYTATDSVVLHHVVTEIPENLQVEELPLKENTTYLPLSLQFNYPYLIIGIILLVIVGLFIVILFGKRIKKWWKLRRMKKQYVNFRSRYHTIIDDQQLKKEEKAVQALVVWKRYMENLTSYPYTKLTTKEIYTHEPHEQLRLALRQIDQVIYSNKSVSVDLKVSYQELEDYTDKQYKKHVEELKNE